MMIGIKKNQILVIMENGEDFTENLRKLKSQMLDIPFATVISAVGMLEKVELGYWNGKEYKIHRYEAPHELVGISGVITPTAEPFYHLHVIIANREGEVKGGHFLRAVVKNTVEMVLLIGEFEVERKNRLLYLKFERR